MLRRILTPVIVAATLVFFAYYLAHHPEVRVQLAKLSIGSLASILLLFGVTFVALAGVLRVSLALYGKKLARGESLLLNAYSTIVNFFGPGQSGPAVRGVYLYKKHGFKLKYYIFTTLLYYACYAVVCAFLLFVGSRPWWQTLLLCIASIAVGWSAIRVYLRRTVKATTGNDNSIYLVGSLSSTIGRLFGLTVIQLAAQTALYYIELRSVDPTITLAQSITYSGAASLALFASLTPGAIGIREAFLIFSQELHHIPISTIVAANVIDRSVYLLFLGILFSITLIFHAHRRFGVRQGKV